MTCIIALEHESKVWMGCDSALLDAWDIRQLVDPKIIHAVEIEMLIGCGGSLRVQQLIRYNLEIPENNYMAHEEDMRYIVNRFIPALRTCLKDGGETKIENNHEEMEAVLLLGWHGKAYAIQRNFQVDRIATRFTAMGVGENYAMGALAVMDTEGRDPERMVLIALEIASTFSNGVCGPFHVFSV